MLDSMDLSAFPEWRRESAGTRNRAYAAGHPRGREREPRTPSSEQVRDGLWVIPGTYLQVGTISSGMRIGDVVFTADMVANVPSLYQPYAREPHGWASTPIAI